MATSLKRPLNTSARPKRTPARPEAMRSYRAASALLMGRREGPVESVEKAVPSGVKPRENGVRVQQQWVISFVAAVAMLALLAGLYLNITASTSIAGREIQTLEIEITSNEQINADLETRIATLMANSVLEQRAQALGFQSIDRKGLQYMVVPGYFPPQPINMISAAAPNEVISQSPEFKETLIDWISKQFQAASVPLAESNR